MSGLVALFVTAVEPLRRQITDREAGPAAVAKA
jgi:hypothetical protein